MILSALSATNHCNADDKILLINNLIRDTGLQLSKRSDGIQQWY